MTLSTLSKAISHINRAGMLLVYPIHNRPEPKSLWSSFFPKSKMRWEWDESADNRVAEMWHLREELASSKKVVYSKWYQGRATFISRELFPLLLSSTGAVEDSPRLNEDSAALLSLLEENSPLSTKQLKKISKLEGKFFESTYTKALKDLWTRFLIVGVGEVDDGAFPSLAIGATRWMFEDLWKESQEKVPSKARTQVSETLHSTLFLTHFERMEKKAFQIPRLESEKRY